MTERSLMLTGSVADLFCNRSGHFYNDHMVIFRLTCYVLTVAYITRPDRSFKKLPSGHLYFDLFCFIYNSYITDPGPFHSDCGVIIVGPVLSYM